MEHILEYDEFKHNSDSINEGYYDQGPYEDLMQQFVDSGIVKDEATAAEIFDATMNGEEAEAAYQRDDMGFDIAAGIIIDGLHPKRDKKLIAKIDKKWR